MTAPAQAHSEDIEAIRNWALAAEAHAKAAESYAAAADSEREAAAESAEHARKLAENAGIEWPDTSPA